MGIILSLPKPRIKAEQTTYVRFEKKVAEANQKRISYKDRKMIDGALRSAFHNDALEGPDFARLLQLLWAI